jgi:thiol-disulfide isomerase/thioredoxin
MKKVILILGILAISLGFLIPKPVQAQDNKMKVYEFWSKYCPHCKAENEFLDKLQRERGDFEVIDYEVTTDQNNAELFKKFADACGNKQYSVPALYIGDRSVIGFESEKTTGQDIITILNTFKPETYQDPSKNVESGGAFKSGSELCQKENVETKRKLPLIGEVDLAKFSLPALSIILGTVDGFNPCAMWALVALLTLLISLGSRKRLILVGGIFLVTSWLISFALLSAFLNAFVFVKFDLAMRLVIGAVALYTAYQLFRSFQKETEECKVSTGKKQIYKHIEKLSTSNFIPFLVFGAIVLAALVNVVEFMCSINLPVVFTKVLSMTSLPAYQKYLYIALYDIFYMLDDIVVFLIALFSMKAFTGFNQKYTRFTKLVGAMVIVILAIMLLFFPKFLVF